MVLFFDLPATTGEDARNYRCFKKILKQEGYIFLQESVYVKLARKSTQIAREWGKIRDISPEGSTVMLLPLSLEEFKRMVMVKGKEFDMSLFSDDVVYI